MAGSWSWFWRGDLVHLEQLKEGGSGVRVRASRDQVAAWVRLHRVACDLMDILMPSVVGGGTRLEHGALVPVRGPDRLVGGVTAAWDFCGAVDWFENNNDEIFTVADALIATPDGVEWRAVQDGWPEPLEASAFLPADDLARILEEPLWPLPRWANRHMNEP